MKLIPTLVASLGLTLVAGAVQPAAAADRPNILFCIADDVSYPHMGAYGTSWVKTPAFDRVAREGILFRNAYTPNAKCAPSRACVLTGRNSWQLDAACNHWCYFPTTFTSYPEALAQHGYTVGGTGKKWAPGVARDAQGKPRSLTGKNYDARKLKPPTTGIGNNDSAANFADFLEDCPEDQPWCFWYGGTEPHRAYEYGTGIGPDRQPSDIDRVPAFWPDTEVVRTDMLDYAREIEWFDTHLGRMLDLLTTKGMLQNTLVVVTADNGMPFPRAKGNAYEFSNHMPLAIMWPAGIQAPGRVLDDYVSFIDFAPTFLEVAGLDWPDSGMEPSPGRSLVNLFNSAHGGRVDPARDHLLIGHERHDVGRPHDWGYPTRGIIRDSWLYVYNFEPTRWPACDPETGYLNCDGSPTKTLILDMRRQGENRRLWELCFGKRPAAELYNLGDDPDCMKNLADTPEQAARQQALHAQLESELRAQADPRIVADGSVFEAFPYADESGRHFYERFMKGEKPSAGWVNPTDFEPGPIEP